jgi:RNA polymerase sigma-70 factor (ECF subfamily)
MKDNPTPPMSYDADAELVELAQAGQRAAFENLFHRHQDRVYSVALGIVGNSSDAKDVVQETFLRAFRRLKSLRKDGGVTAYLCKTAANAAIDIVRARKTGRSVSMEAISESGIDIADLSRGPEALAESRTDNESLMAALLSLPEDQRTVLVLHHLQEMRVDEIAARLRIPIGTVKSRLGRGREALRRRLTGKIR